MPEWFSADGAVALITLTVMEIVLGIDNIVFISILVERLPDHQQSKARNIGMGLALVLRLGLLFSVSWIMSLTYPIFSILGRGFSGRDLILLLGGLFLVGKATSEIHSKVEGGPIQHGKANGKGNQFAYLLIQILLLDIVFSLDSVITAVGMAKDFEIMAAAMIIAVTVMILAAKSVGTFISHHPTVKILALSFLLLIGVMLLVEGMGGHVAKGYIYFAMGFSILVELLNMRYRTKQAISRA